MKTNSFLVGAILGAAATVAVTKKFFKCSSCEENEACDNPVLKDADDAVEKLRNSVDSLRKELNSRIESEQTFAAKAKISRSKWQSKTPKSITSRMFAKCRIAATRNSKKNSLARSNWRTSLRGA